ncbi:MAG: DNA polymerase I [Flavobacteriaceae bacterium]|nr:DNA polymerase I [Flavobacteriaceae bacterium]|tara:strand:+ start:241 stop:3042 length:2802 start_codon:yes stop_codon:yes gene_type:complete
MSKKRLFLLDAYALIFRGYYAFIKNPRINSKGMDTSAILGFTNSLFDVIKKERPDHLAVAFDKGGSKFRNDIFSEYKANRAETPEAIKIAVPYIKKLLKALHIPIIELEGYEADDIIGTLAKQAEKEYFEVFMVTPDKDFAQLVSENIFMYRPARMGNGIEIWGIPEVQKKFEITHPEQVIDYLGMMGDSVDNIPGLPGVGEKTAKKFIAQYGSMEQLLANTADLKGKLKEKIETNKALGLLSKKLARIMLDVPVHFDSNEYKLSDPNIIAVSELFQELEFRRLSETFVKVFKPTEATPESTKTETKAATAAFDLFNQPGSGQIESMSAFKSLDTVSHHYQCVQTELERELLLQTMQRQKSVCFDTETTGLDAVSASLIGIAFSWQAHTGYYVPIPDDADERKAIIDSLIPFFEDEAIEKVGQNLKYDLKVMQQHGISVKGKLFDTMLAHYIINPDMRHNMDVLAETYLGYHPKPITDLIGKKGKNQGSMRDVPIDQQTEYAAEDADITWQLKEHFEKELGKNEQRALLDKVELPLVRVLAAMELAGISIDLPYLNDMSNVLKQEATALEQRIFEKAGETFNLASPKQLGPVLFDKLKLVEKPKKTKTGQYSTAEEVLSTISKDHPIVSDILEWRSVQKLKNTYVTALPDDINEKTNRIHTVYNQAVAATGRLSSNHPNLQNIPIRTPRGREVRKAFIAKDDEHVLMAADYSQIELRIIASLSEDPSMLAAFNNNEDIHAATAAKVFGVPLAEVNREQRSQAKTVNFGIIYGVSAFGLSNQTTLSRKESKGIIDAYYENYPKLKAYMAQQVDFAREHGYVATVLGRRRYLKDINSRNAIVRGAAERNAINAPIQGSAADIIKLAMLTIYDKMQQQHFKAQMLLQVHDELVFECPKSELNALKQLVKTEMEAAYSLQVPLIVDMGIGHNWLEAH